MELGQVVDDADPKGLGRVRLIVPGIIDEPSPWAPPIGTLGGGGPQRGFFVVPPKGSDVAVFFHRGDPERPYYMAGHWGEPDAGAEVPEDVKEAPAAERSRIAAFDTAAWKVTYDDRLGHQAIRLAHKVLNMRIDIDATTGVLEIVSEGAVNVTAAGQVSVEAPHIQIGGRVVLQNGKPIS